MNLDEFRKKLEETQALLNPSDLGNEYWDYEPDGNLLTLDGRYGLKDLELMVEFLKSQG